MWRLNLLLPAYITADFDNLCGFKRHLVWLVRRLDDVALAARLALAVVAMEGYTLERWALEGAALERGPLEGATSEHV